jgi:hypothetical protein
MRSPVREETLVPIRSFRLDECEALEAKLRQSCQGQVVNHMKCEHLTRRVSTGMKVPGKTAPHLVYFFWEWSIEFCGLFLLSLVVPNSQKYTYGLQKRERPFMAHEWFANRHAFH